MKRLVPVTAALVVLALAVLAPWASAAPAPPADRAATAGSSATDGGAAPAGLAPAAGPVLGFERFLRRFEDANSAFVNGDPAPWLAITAERDPASIFGGFGGRGDAGTAEVRQRYLLAAGAFRPSGARVDFEYLVKDVRGRLAYTVAIERADVLYAGRAERQQQVLRTTMVFRHERGAWRIAHRHADTMIDLQLPTP